MADCDTTLAIWEKTIHSTTRRAIKAIGRSYYGTDEEYAPFQRMEGCRREPTGLKCVVEYGNAD